MAIKDQQYNTGEACAKVTPYLLCCSSSPWTYGTGCSSKPQGTVYCGKWNHRQSSTNAASTSTDVILFIRPTAQKATSVKEILRIFGEAFGLQTNLAKCSITPIFDGEDNLQELANILGCQVQPFPIRYLGLPLSTKRLPKAHLQSMVEAVARKLPPSHGSLMARSGRLI